MAIIDFGGSKEEVVTRREFPMSKALKVLKNETVAVIGYGVQGPAQSLNMRDNGVNVVVGQAKQFQRDWDRAQTLYKNDDISTAQYDQYRNRWESSEAALNV